MQYSEILKLVEKVKFLPLFQAVYLQNLENFKHREGHQFKFQCLGDSKDLKLWNGVRPTCQLPWPLNWPARSDAKVAQPPPATSRRPTNPATRCPRVVVTPPLPLLSHHLDEEKRHFARRLELTCAAALLHPPLPVAMASVTPRVSNLHDYVNHMFKIH
jgi:hypothetical protein